MILEVNREPVLSAQEYEKLVSKIGEHDTVLLIYREGVSIHLTIKP